MSITIKAAFWLSISSTLLHGVQSSRPSRISARPQPERSSMSAVASTERVSLKRNGLSLSESNRLAIGKIRRHHILHGDPHGLIDCDFLVRDPPRPPRQQHLA